MLRISAVEGAAENELSADKIVVLYGIEYSIAVPLLVPSDCAPNVKRKNIRHDQTIVARMTYLHDLLRLLGIGRTSI